MSAELLRLIHLAKLPELRRYGKLISLRGVRCVLAAIVIHTDNGRKPQPIYVLAEAADLHREMFRHYVEVLVMAGLVEMGPQTAARAVGLSACRSLRVNGAKLQKLATTPLHERDPVVALDVEPGAGVLASLLAIREAALAKFGIGVAVVGTIAKGTPAAERRRRLTLRAQVVKEIGQMAKRKGVKVNPYVIGRLLGVESAQIHWATKSKAAAASTVRQEVA